MKRLIILILLLPVILCLIQAGKPITVVEFVHPPFAYQDPQSNEPKGAEIAYLMVVLKDMGYQPTFIFVPFPRMIYNLKSGNADIGPFLTKTSERENFSYYSSKPVLTMIPVLVVLKNSPLKQLKTPSDLIGLKIGFSASQTIPPFFANSELPPFDLAMGDNTTERNLKKLIAQHIDASIELNPYNVRMIVKPMGIANSIRTIDIPGSETMFYVIISKKSKIAPNILKDINASINSKKYDFENFLQKELR